MIVTVDEAKAHLRIEDDDEDVYLESLITRAQAVAEDFCRTNSANAVRLAVLLFVSYYYENRDSPDRTAYGTMRMAFENLLYPYRDPDKMF